jgi:CRP-like cAMP-binding protein
LNRDNPVQNKLLLSLSPADLATIEPALEPVELVKDQILGAEGELLSHFWFIEHGLVSAFATVDGTTVDVAIVIADGMVGASLLYLPSQPCAHSFKVRIAGDALRLPVDALRQALPRGSPEMQEQFKRLVHAAVQVNNQFTACNRVHRISGSAARC